MTESVAEVLLEHLERHEQQEADILGKYRASARRARDPEVRLMMRAVIQDEKRHHSWIASLAEGIRDLGRSAEAKFSSSEGSRGRLLAETDEFITAERDALAELKALKRTVAWAETGERALYRGQELARSADSTEWMKNGPLELIVEMMIDDTKRHIRVLQFIEARLQLRPAAADAPGPERDPVAAQQSMPVSMPRVAAPLEPDGPEESAYLAVEDHHSETCQGIYEADPYDVLASTVKPDCKTSYEWGEASAVNPMIRPGA